MRIIIFLARYTVAVFAARQWHPYFRLFVYERERERERETA